MSENSYSETLKVDLAAAYPDNNPKTALGQKKPAFHAIPPVALIHLGQAMMNGKMKYGLFNWRDRKVTASVYFDAKLRHTFAWWDGEDFATDSLCHHLAHDMACNAIALDAMANGTFVDDRGLPGAFSRMVAQLTKKD